MAYAGDPGHCQSHARSPAESCTRTRRLLYLPQLPGLASGAQAAAASLWLWHQTRTRPDRDATWAKLVSRWKMDSRNGGRIRGHSAHPSVSAQVVAIDALQTQRHRVE